MSAPRPASWVDAGAKVQTIVIARNPMTAMAMMRNLSKTEWRWRTYILHASLGTVRDSIRQANLRTARSGGCRPLTMIPVREAAPWPPM